MTNNSNIRKISNDLSDLRSILKSHDLYKSLHSLEDAKIFMENHIFAVLGFYVLTQISTLNLLVLLFHGCNWRPVLTKFINK